MAVVSPGSSSGPALRRTLSLTTLLLAGALHAENRVAIITPHNEAIRYEFGRAFEQWHQEQFQVPAVVEWRVVGGSSDALKFVQSEFVHKPEGIGLDCFFGGGQEPYLLLADKKLLEPFVPGTLAGIPQNFSGVEIYDVNHRWFGAALSSFGILQNLRVQRRLNLPPAARWEDLTRPELRGWVGAGDPRGSGTMAVMFESFLQFHGWERGWRMLAQLGGNVRQFDRVSSTTAKDVTLGETAYGLAIDFYGFTQVAEAGASNLTFVLPRDFTSLSPDGLAILRGAPHRETARRFVDFVLSEAGQKLWFLPRGHPGGPQKNSIERMTVRPDFYARFRDVSNIQHSPFDLPQTFRYDANLARTRREILPALIGALLVDPHAELQAAWQAVIRRGLRESDLAELGRAPLTEAELAKWAAKEWKEPAFRNAKKIEWQTWAREKYRALVGAKAGSLAQ